MNWIRAVIGGVLAEVLVAILIAPVALAVGLETLADPANLPPVLGYSIVIASFVAPLVLTQWVARRVHARLLLHGGVVGFTAFAVYMIPMLLSGAPQPAIYWVAHAMKIAGGLTGGYVAARRRSARPALI